ncbi:Hypothetical protein GLP15_1072 [Giardia lamblia P15]|uniref:Uncharacterized protein n=1 Tax=Giardia intestinalis (strain P15) TaxID=658858 RepID=E1F2M6_GIAIA|nr:Hypothetical protein GLP15_1072 [Giardia lamblia P15]
MALSSSQIAVLKEVFYIYEDPTKRSGPIRDDSTDPTGRIRKSDLLRFLRALGLPFTLKDIADYTSQYSITGNSISFTDAVTLVTAWKRSSHPDPSDAISVIFNACTPRDGVITIQKLKSVICSSTLEDSITSVDFDLLISDHGFSGNSVLTLPDLLKLLGPPTPLV